MVDIRNWWSDIENSEIDAISTYSNYELLILSRMIGRIGGGTEISREDLLQSLPSDKLGKGGEAIDRLVKKQILLAKPKPKLTVYQVNPKNYTEPLQKFLKNIRTDKNLKKSLIEEQVTFTKTSETLIEIYNNSFKGHKFCNLSSIKPSEKKLDWKEEFGIVVEIEFRCKRCDGTKCFEFEILDPRSIFTLTELWSCECGEIYNCTACGKIICVS